MSEDEEIILDEICTLSTSVDGLIQCLQSSSEKVNDIGAQRTITVMKEITDEYGEKTTRAKQIGMILSI
jgi:hypothetical protein